MVKKMRTSITPHKATRYASIFEAKLHKVDNREDGTGWMTECEIIQPDGNKFVLIVEARYNLNGKHAQLFDYALSRANANGTKTVSFNIEEYLEESDRGTEEWRQKERAIKVLEQLRGFSLGIKVGTSTDYYPLIGEISTDTKTGICTVTFNNKLDDLIKRAGERYFNISKTLALKGGKAYELGKYIQLNGRGIDKRTGEPSYVKEFTFAQAVQYLHLEPKTPKSGVTTINRLLRQLEKAGYPKYRETTKYLWTRVFG